MYGSSRLTESDLHRPNPSSGKQQLGAEETTGGTKTTQESVTGTYQHADPKLDDTESTRKEEALVARIKDAERKQQLAELRRKIAEIDIQVMWFPLGVYYFRFNVYFISISAK